MWRNISKNVALEYAEKLKCDPVDLMFNKLSIPVWGKVNLLKAVELENISIQLPDTLSVGMRQRVALARTLMEETEIVLMDEPFSSLDYITRSNIQNLSRKLLKNKTVIMVTHDPTEALLLSDNLLLIENQKLTKLELPNSRPMRSIKQKDFSEYYEKTINRLKQAYIVSW